MPCVRENGQILNYFFGEINNEIKLLLCKIFCAHFQLRHAIHHIFINIRCVLISTSLKV